MKLRESRSRAVVIVTGIGILFALTAAISFAIYQARASAISEWRTQLRNTSLLLAQQTANEMSAASLVLDGLLDRIRLLDIRNDAQLRQLLSTAEEFDRLVSRQKVLPQIDVVSVVAANGDLLNFTRQYPAPKISLAERDYLQYHRQHRDGATRVSAPVRNKGNGEWTFYLSRRINAPDGTFLGVVLVGVSSRQLSDFFSKINLGDDATVTLYRRDFTTLARWPHSDAQMGVKNTSGSSYEVVERQNLSAGVVVVDTPRQAQGGERVVRMGAVRMIPNHQLIINVTVTNKLFLAQWRAFAWQLAGIGILCALAVLAALAFLLGEMRRRDDAVREQRSLKAEADSANRAKSDFLAMISHEIRTPLTAVIGFADELAYARTPQETVEIGRVIAQNGRQLLTLINDILDMSKIEAGRLEIETLPFAPLEVLEAVRGLMCGQAERRGLTYTNTVMGHCPDQVHADPTRWRQILINLVSNAIKFTERGGIELILRYEEATERLVCTVVDSGVGMDELQLGRLFSPFLQADHSIARRFGGTGLGLYLVRQLAVAMEGGVDIKSHPKVGTQITVWIHAPCAPAGAPPPRAAPGSGTPGLFAGSVLVVDDSVDNRRLITTILGRCGVRVLSADNGNEGVQKALSTLPDLVLMDIQMPVLDGVVATRALRERGFTRPIVAFTANVTSADQAHYRASGFDAWLAKPIASEQLNQVLMRFLHAAAEPTVFADLPEYPALLQAFLDGLPHTIAGLERALAANDLQDLLWQAHSLKGYAASFGCPEAGAAAGAIERACRAGDGATAEEALQALRLAVRREAQG